MHHLRLLNLKQSNRKQQSKQQKKQKQSSQYHLGIALSCGYRRRSSAASCSRIQQAFSWSGRTAWNLAHEFALWKLANRARWLAQGYFPTSMWSRHLRNCEEPLISRKQQLCRNKHGVTTSCSRKKSSTPGHLRTSSSFLNLCKRLLFEGKLVGFPWRAWGLTRRSMCLVQISRKPVSTFSIGYQKKINNSCKNAWNRSMAALFLLAAPAPEPIFAYAWWSPQWKNYAKSSMSLGKEHMLCFIHGEALHWFNNCCIYTHIQLVDAAPLYVGLLYIYIYMYYFHTGKSNCGHMCSNMSPLRWI